jgi:hypothetical protein
MQSTCSQANDNTSMPHYTLWNACELHVDEQRQCHGSSSANSCNNGSKGTLDQRALRRAGTEALHIFSATFWPLHAGRTKLLACLFHAALMRCSTSSMPLLGVLLCTSSVCWSAPTGGVDSGHPRGSSTSLIESSSAASVSDPCSAGASMTVS